MAKATIDKVTDSIDKHIDQFREFSGKRRMLEDRLSKVDKEKDSVAEDIYRKVREEYKSQLEDIARQMTPIEEEMTRVRDAITSEQADISDRRKHVQGQLDELAFRHRVGEYDETEFSRVSGPLKEQIASMDRRSDEITGTIRKLDDARPPTGAPTTTTAETKPTDTAPRLATDQTTPKTDNKERTAEQPPPNQQNLVNPSEWMEEFAQENKSRRSTDPLPTSPQTPATEPSPPTRTTDPDPLASLADPSEETAGQSPAGQKQPSTGVRETATSFPVLIITKGPGSGKKMPLVPMTMTVGREHDNNIELKDEEVARYHARITHHNGDYILQDLESSSGTWVNNMRVTETRLKHGDKIRVGNTEMLIDFD